MKKSNLAIIVSITIIALFLMTGLAFGQIYVHASGNVGIGTTSPDAKLNVQNGTDVSLSGGGFIVNGDLSGLNIGIDNNEIMARNNGGTSTLYLQAEGGDIEIGDDLNFKSGGQLDFYDEVGDKAYWYSNIYGTGIESYTLTNWAYQFRWRTGGTSVSSGTERMLLTNNGNLKLHNKFYLDMDDDWIRLLDGDDGSYQDYGIAAYRFWSQMAYASWSDIRLKEDIQLISNSLDKISQLEGVKFKWKESGNYGIGLIAQDVEKVFPEVVDEGPDGYKGIAYGSLIAPLIESVKALKDENDELKTRIEALENAVNEINQDLIE